MFAHVTIPGSAIVPGDVLADRPAAPVEEIGNTVDNTRALFFADGHGMRVVHVDRRYSVLRKTESPSHASVLVVGPVATPAQIDDVTAFAFDVCDQLGHSTVVATNDRIDVREFAAVVVYGPSLTHGGDTGITPAVILEAEAHAYDVPVIVPQPMSYCAACDACEQVQTIATVRNEMGEPFCADCRGDAPGCSWCGADEVTEPVFVDGMWSPQCLGCAAVTKKVRPSERNLVDEPERLLAEAV